jgi:hypothetical protein
VCTPLDEDTDNDDDDDAWFTPTLSFDCMGSVAVRACDCGTYDPVVCIDTVGNGNGVAVAAAAVTCSGDERTTAGGIEDEGTLATLGFATPLAATDDVVVVVVGGSGNVATIGVGGCVGTADATARTGARLITTSSSSYSLTGYYYYYHNNASLLHY